MFPRSNDFNSRPSARGDLRRTRFWRLARYFNSRPSARGDVRTWSNWDGTSISIHAPPRGATKRWGFSARCTANFNSRPSARGDRVQSTNQSGLRPFQFTPLREGRPEQSATRCLTHFISIHAPPRGATLRFGQFFLHFYFNSRPSARGDLERSISMSAFFAFQFTPLREGRPQKICNFCKSFVQPLQISMA